MSDRAFARIAGRDSGSFVVNEFLAHPDFPTISAFFLGWVFLGSIYHLLGSTFVHVLFRRYGSRVYRALDDVHSEKLPAADVEAPPLSKKPESLVAHDGQAVGRDDDAFAVVLNICFAFAGFAQFTSLLDFGSHVGNAGCTVVVAWGSMASQSARLVGLMMLSWKLRCYGVKHWEVYVLWTGLVVALALILASNATNTGTTTLVQQLGIVLCYKQHYLPVALSSSLFLILLESYIGARLVSVVFFRPKWLSTSSLVLNIARAASLLILELLTVVPAVIYLNVLATFIPFAVGALLVIAVFNYTESPPSERGYSASRASSVSVLDAQRMSSHTFNSLLSPRPFMLRFPSTQQPPNISEGISENKQASSTGAVEDVRNIRSLRVYPVDPDDEDDLIGASRGIMGAMPRIPRSAPARLDDPGHFTPLPARKILPSQTQFAEQLDQLDQQAELSAPAIRRPRDRPQVFVVIEEDATSAPAKTPASAVFGSDIIRLTPLPSRRKRHETSILSPESSAFSPTNRSTQSSWRESLMSAYTTRSPRETPTPDDNRLRAYWNGNMSPRESLRPNSWRTTSRVSFASVRTPVRDLPELPVVMEGPTDGRLSTSTARIKSKRRTFGRQSFRYMPQDMMQALTSRSRDTLAPVLPVSIPNASLSQVFKDSALRSRSPAESMPPPPLPTSIPNSLPSQVFKDSAPLSAPPAEPLSPLLAAAAIGTTEMLFPPSVPEMAMLGIGRGRGRPLGTLRGPRPPPAILSPQSLDQWRWLERTSGDSTRERKRRSSMSDLPLARQEL